MIAFFPIKWCSDAAQKFAPLMTCLHGIAGLREDVICGSAVLYSVRIDAEQVGYFVGRVDILAGGNEYVLIVAAGANPRRVSLVDLILPQVEELARRKDCKAIRIHSTRPGLIKKMVKRGYSAREIVFSKGL